VLREAISSSSQNGIFPKGTLPTLCVKTDI